MTRAQLEHIIRAAADLADDDEIIVIGSQSVLGQFPDAPAALLRSVEADVYPKNRPERADLIDGSIGELSPIRNANTRNATGWCLEIHDLLVSQLVAGREKDIEFIEAAAAAGLARREVLADRLAATEMHDEVRALANARLARAFVTT